MVPGRHEDAHADPFNRGTSGLVPARYRSRIRRHSFGLAAAIVLAVVVVGTDLGSLAVDTKPSVYLDPWGTLRETLSAWQEVPALGQSSFQVGLAPVAFVVGLLQALGLPPWLSVRVLRWLLFVIGSLGMAALARDVIGAVGRDGRSASPWGPRAAAFVFVLHPYLLVAGVTLPVLWPAAVLPWQLWCVHRAMRSGRTLHWALWFALATAAMTGQNAGAVVALQSVSVPVVLLWAARLYRRRVREVAAFVVVGGGATLLLSAYWLLPTLGAVGAGASVVQQSESPEAIAATSSFAEVLRGLGLWPLYGRTGTQPWQGEQSLLITSPGIVLAGFALPLLAWALTRRVDRRAMILPVLLTAVAVVVMVGSHPIRDPSPVGSVWGWALANLPALGVLRTTNKAGAALVIGIALLAALGVAASRTRQAPRFLLVAAVALVAVLPAWSGGLFISHVDVPEYWKRAAADVGEGPGRVWLLPGQSSANYRWSDARPDDVGQTLIDRASLVRTTVGNTSAQGANLLSSVDRQLQEGTLTPDGLAVASRYLGVGSLLVRNDVVSDDSGGASPREVMTQVQGSRGVRARSTHGEPTDDSEGQPQLAVFDVLAPVGVAGLADPTSQVVISGDGAALGTLAQLGYLDGRRPYRYVSDTSAADLLNSARAGGRLVLTDTNRREPRVANRLTEDHGRLRAPDEPVEQTWALGTAADQSVLSRHGWQARATNEGSLFRELPWSRAENAIDGDVRTVWSAGDFGTALGQHVDVDLGREREAGRLTVRTVGPVTALKVTAGGSATEMTTVQDGVFVADLALSVTTVQTLRVELTGLREGDDGGAGIAEVELAGAFNSDSAAVRTPTRTSEIHQELDPDSRAVLSRMPTDVVLRRVTAGAGRVPDEADLRRDVVLPAGNRVSVRGAFTLAATMPERVLDEIAGDVSGVEVTSSSRAFDLPTVRASMALDGDAGTGWAPAEPAVGANWRVRPAQPVVADAITVGQPMDGRQITAVEVVVNDRAVTRSSLAPGVTRIALGSSVRVESLELRLLDVSTPASESVRLLEVGLGDVRVARSPGQACFTAATLDGDPVRLRPAAPITQTSFLAAACDEATPLTVTEGIHAWRPVPGFVADTVTWADADSPTVAEGSANAWRDLAFREYGLGRWSAELPATDRPQLLVSGMGYDPRWRLELDGRDLGSPQVANGYAAAWPLPAGRGGPVTLNYAPQSTVTWGLALTGVALLAVVALLTTPRLRREGPRVSAVQPSRLPSVGSRASARACARAGRPNVEMLLTSVLLVAGSAAIGGWVGAAIAVAALVVEAWRREATWWLALACWALLPVVWFMQAAPLLGEITPDLVTRTAAAHEVGAAAVIVSAVHVSLIWPRR